MLIPIFVLGFLAICLFLIINKISTDRAAKIRALENKKRSMNERFQFMVSQRAELRKEIVEKERMAVTLRNNQEGIKTISATDLDVDESDDNEKVSRYLIQEGKITLEQNEKILQKMGIMQMDYLGSCLALGFIDLDTAKKAIKINKITTKSAGLN